MNVQLEKLLSKTDFSPKDRYDFLQIYSLLPEHKKVGVLDNFDNIQSEITALRDDLHTQQEILLGEAIGNIEEKIKMKHQKAIVQTSREQMIHLKGII